jgi:hypothetical protein
MVDENPYPRLAFQESRIAEHKERAFNFRHAYHYSPYQSGLLKRKSLAARRAPERVPFFCVQYASCRFRTPRFFFNLAAAE